MDIGIVGFRNHHVARHLAEAGVRVRAFDARGGASTATAGDGVTAMPTAVALARALPAPRVVWLDVAPGPPTELMIEEVWPELAAGDVIVDAAAAAHFRDSRRRAAALGSVGIHFVDCALHGDVGREECALLTGGHADAARIVAPFAALLAPGPGGGWRHCGPAGAAHYVRMILGAVEVAQRSARAEGLALLRGRHEFGLDVKAMADLWRLGGDGDGGAVPGAVASGAIDEAVEQGVPSPVLSLALMLALDGRGPAAAALGDAVPTRDKIR